MIKKLSIILVLLFSFSYSQNIFPKSLLREPGITILSYDNKTHRSVNHYKKLYEILCTEYNLKVDTTYILLCFVTEEQRNKINLLNNDFYILGPDWSGFFIVPNTIIIVDESDNVFFHEMMHYLYNRGLIFNNVPEDKVHSVIYICENLMIISKSYIEYINTIK